MQVTVPVANCNAGTGQFCAGNIKRQKAFCNGDSGGPALVFRNNEYYQCGIVSGGKFCNATTYDSPNIYTRISTWYSWIEKAVAALTGCQSTFLSLPT